MTSFPGWKKTVLIILDLVLIAVTLAFIFGNSMKGKKESFDASNTVKEIVEEKIPSIKDAVENDKISNRTLIEIVRSAAHMIEFCALGIETMIFILLAGLKPLSLSAFIPLFFCLAAGVTDEYLQTFNDRSSEVIDVIKDFGGSVIGALIVLGVYSIFCLVAHRKKQINKNLPDCVL